MREAIRRRDAKGEPVREIARTYNVSHSTISRLALLGCKANTGEIKNLIQGSE